jgi:hypothetical protein
MLFQHGLLPSIFPVLISWADFASVKHSKEVVLRRNYLHMQYARRHADLRRGSDSIRRLLETYPTVVRKLSSGLPAVKSTFFQRPCLQWNRGKVQFILVHYPELGQLVLLSKITCAFGSKYFRLVLVRMIHCQVNCTERIGNGTILL